MWHVTYQNARNKTEDKKREKGRGRGHSIICLKAGRVLPAHKSGHVASFWAPANEGIARCMQMAGGYVGATSRDGTRNLLKTYSKLTQNLLGFDRGWQVGGCDDGFGFDRIRQVGGSDGSGFSRVR